jgi:hypothetical protein
LVKEKRRSRRRKKKGRRRTRPEVLQRTDEEKGSDEATTPEKVEKMAFLEGERPQLTIFVSRQQEETTDTHPTFLDGLRSTHTMQTYHCSQLMETRLKKDLMDEGGGEVKTMRKHGKQTVAERRMERN